MTANNKLIYSIDGKVLIKCDTSVGGEVKLKNGIEGIYQALSGIV